MKGEKKMKKGKKAGAKKSKPVDNEGDIISLILRDHVPLKGFIATLKDSKTSIEDKRKVFQQFSLALTQHSNAEEESLYVQLKKEHGLRIDGLKGDTEHGLASHLIKEIHEVKNDGEKWLAKTKVLAELVGLHIKAEESGLLLEVREEFDQKARLQMGQDYSRLLSENQEANAANGKNPDPAAEHAAIF